MMSSPHILNPIAERQSSAEFVNFAAGFRQAYERVRDAKVRLWVFTVLLALVQLLAALQIDFFKSPSASNFLTLANVGLLIAIMLGKTIYKYLVIDPSQELACNIQQLHEHKILELGECPSFTAARPATINALADQWLASHPHDRRNLELWWPRIVSTIPYTPGKLICLLSTFQWEYELRRKYQYFLWAILGGVIVSSLFLMYMLDYLLGQYILLILVPITPFVELVLEETFTNKNCIDTAKEATEESVKLWDLMTSKRMTANQVETELNRLLVYWQQYYRLSATPIFGWLYRVSLRVMDKAMTVDAEDLVKRYCSPSSVIKI